MNRVRQQLSGRMKAAFAAGLLVVLILLGFTGWELSKEFTRSRELRVEVSESYETRLQIESVLTLLIDAETGTRGYVLTGQKEYLEPYDAAVKRIGPQMELLRRRFVGRPAETAELAQLNRLATEKLAIAARGIAAKDRGGVTAALSSTPNNRGKHVMDQARASIARMVDLEAANLERFSRDTELRTARTEHLVIALFLTLVAVLVAAILLAARYVATRKAMLEDIRSQVARQQVIFNSAIDAIVTLNPSGSIETVNVAAETMFGYSAAELDRRDISLLVDIATDGDGEFLKRLGASQGALERGLIRQMEAKRRAGDVFPVDVALGAMHLPTGTHIVAVIRDVSERKRIEQLKDEFVSTVSHELRTPLTSIAGSLGLLAGGAAGPLPDKAGRLIQIAHANSQRLVRLINDILDIEKIESGKLRLDLAPQDLRDIAERSIDGVRGYAEELGVSLSLAAGEPAPVRGDADRLIQVVTNLLSNASKFSPAGSVVSVTVDPETRLARLSVSDNGPGIPDAFRARIFSKFAQADGSDTRAKGGTGLGLAIAREITERHGGRLWFESAPGEGSTFHLDLPLASAGDAVMDADGPRLLIVEDDFDAASLLKEMLEADGFAAEIATTGRQAMTMIRHGDYAAILLDIHLPDADGIALIRALRSDPETRDLPIVVVSGDAARGKARAQSLEVIDWMEKPFDQARLRTAVAAIYQRQNDRLPRILHVDDDRDILEVTASALAGTAEMSGVESLAAARHALSLSRPDLIILDLGLPDGSGLELLSELRDEQGHSIPVIVYSAQEMDAALANRVEAVLTKSKTSLAGLARTVRRLTDNSSLKREASDA
jgi:PAS domain S-box-containing protein